MENHVFQDWITAAGASTTPFVQEAKDWLGLASFSDVVFYLEIKQLVGTPAPGLTWNFQTAPTKDERLFQTLKSYGTSGIPPGGVQVFPRSRERRARRRRWRRGCGGRSCRRVVPRAGRRRSG
jgi:hypothetical protein